MNNLYTTKMFHILMFFFFYFFVIQQIFKGVTFAWNKFLTFEVSSAAFNIWSCIYSRQFNRKWKRILAQIPLKQCWVIKAKYTPIVWMILWQEIALLKSEVYPTSFDRITWQVLVCEIFMCLSMNVALLGFDCLLKMQLYDWIVFDSPTNM